MSTDKFIEGCFGVFLLAIAALAVIGIAAIAVNCYNSTQKPIIYRDNNCLVVKRGFDYTAACISVDTHPETKQEE